MRYLVLFVFYCFDNMVFDNILSFQLYRFSSPAMCVLGDVLRSGQARLFSGLADALVQVQGQLRTKVSCSWHGAILLSADCKASIAERHGKSYSPLPIMIERQSKHNHQCEQSEAGGCPYRLGSGVFLLLDALCFWCSMVICPSTCSVGWRRMPRSLLVAVRMPSP